MCCICYAAIQTKKNYAAVWILISHFRQVPANSYLCKNSQANYILVHLRNEMNTCGLIEWFLWFILIENTVSRAYTKTLLYYLCFEELIDFCIRWMISTSTAVPNGIVGRCQSLHVAALGPMKLKRKCLFARHKKNRRIFFYYINYFNNYAVQN